MSASTGRLGTVLDTYFRKRLKRSIHPAIAAARDQSEATSTFLKPFSNDQPVASSDAVVVGLQREGVSTLAPTYDDQDYGVSLYDILYPLTLYYPDI